MYSVFYNIVLYITLKIVPDAQTKPHHTEPWRISKRRTRLGATVARGDQRLDTEEEAFKIGSISMFLFKQTIINQRACKLYELVKQKQNLKKKRKRSKKSMKQN